MMGRRPSSLLSDHRLSLCAFRGGKHSQNKSHRYHQNINKAMAEVHYKQ